MCKDLTEADKGKVFLRSCWCKDIYACPFCSYHHSGSAVFEHHLRKKHQKELMVGIISDYIKTLIKASKYTQRSMR